MFMRACTFVVLIMVKVNAALRRVPPVPISAMSCVVTFNAVCIARAAPTPCPPSLPRPPFSHRSAKSIAREFGIVRESLGEGVAGIGLTFKA